MTPELLDYISKARVAGLDDSQIRQNLIASGWPQNDVEQALRDSQPSAPASASVMSATNMVSTAAVEPAKATALSRVKVSPKILGIVVALIVLAVGGYFAYAKGLPMLAFAQFVKNPTVSVDGPLHHYELAATFKGKAPGQTQEDTATVSLKGDVDSTDTNKVLLQNFLSLNTAVLESDVSIKDAEIRGIGKDIYLQVSQVPYIMDMATEYDGWVLLRFDEVQKKVSEGKSLSKDEIFKNVNISSISSQQIFVGRENLNGVQTYHYSLIVDKAALINVLTQVRKNIDPGIDFAQTKTDLTNQLAPINIDNFDIWIGSSDKQLHKILLSTTTFSKTDVVNPQASHLDLSLTLTPGKKLQLSAPPKAFDIFKTITGQ